MSMTIEQYYEQFSDSYLRDTHEGARRAYEHDRALTPEQKESAKYFRSPFTYYGTDEQSDWAEHVDELEKAMTKKGIDFTPIQKS